MGKKTAIFFGIVLLINTVLIGLLYFGQFYKSEKVTGGETQFVQMNDIHFQGKVEPAFADSSIVEDWAAFRKKYPHLVDSINMVQDSVHEALTRINNIDIGQLTRAQQSKSNDLFNLLCGVNRKLDQVIDVAKLGLLQQDMEGIKAALTMIDKNVAQLKKVADITEKITSYLQVILQALDILTGTGIIKPPSVSSIQMSL